MTILAVNNLSIDYLVDDVSADSGQKTSVLHAVEDVNFSLELGGSLGIVGESGCGKTTLMLALMRLLPEAGRISKGEILFDGRDLLKMSEKEMFRIRWAGISMVFQGAMNALNPVRTIESQIVEVLLHHGVAENKRQAKIRSGKLLELVGIAPRRGSQYPHQYSGGMRQRAILAMALSCNPKVLIADEPTTALDVMIQAQIIDLLTELQAELNLSLIIVTHDLGVVAETCDDVLVMYGGKVAEYTSCDTIFNQPIHPYTQRLLQAFPDVARPDFELASIPGVPPRLDNLPVGCRFSPRCHLCENICHQEPPRMYEFGHQHWAACHLLVSPR